MSATNFNTKNDTYRKLMGNGLTYRIPRFQRDYSWGEEEWDDLWQDILGTIAEGGEPAHYMGYLVLQSADDRVFDVIDGQQRLTTLSIIVLAALKNLQRLIDEGKDADRTRQRLDQLRQTYIGYLDPVTLVPRSKLTLNRNNDNYYQTYLVPLAEHLPQRRIRASEHGLRKSFEWFNQRVRDYVKTKPSADVGMIIAQLIESMSDRLFFTVITVTDELNAYKVFETLNARGVRLSATDLLKNYLFSVLHRQREHEHELKNLEDRWENMVGRLGSESLPDFLRMHWNSRNAFVRQSELFKVIRGQVATREQVFELLRGMDEDVDLYLALTSPEGSPWPPAWRGHASELRMFSVRQPFPLLMAAKRRLSDPEFETLLRACVTISFRYNVIGGLHTGDQERVYHSVAQRIANGTLTTSASVLDALKGIYPADDAFRATFADKFIKTTASRNKKIVRYILCALEKQASGQDFEFESASYNLEHILPQNPAAGWEGFTDEELDAFVYRLGNMALMESGPNREVGNADFATKKAAYAVSMFSLTRKIAEENEEWTPSRIEARQRALAKIATSIWRVAQLA
ncbi:MAG: DUF262 domain-containing HNH endonuclease family protein [Candidatus Competibacteraceae bacterium]